MSVERIPLLVLYSFYRVSGEGLFKKSQFRNSEGACVLPWRPRVLPNDVFSTPSHPPRG